MGTSRLRVQFVAVAAVALCVAVASPGVALARRPSSTVPDVTVLFKRAVRIVRATNRPRFARAVVLEADGVTRGGRPTRSASGIVRWRFIFDNQPSHSRFRSATIFYGPPPRRFGRIRGYRSPFLEDRVIPKAPRMTLRQAVARLQRAGYRRAFFNVTLRDPLGPGVRHALYIFGFGSGRYVGVDTVTRRVAPLS